MVAIGKAVTRHVLGREGLPKYVYHPEFRNRRAWRDLLGGIEVLLRRPSIPNVVEEAALFKALHYCAFRAHQASGRRVVVTAASRRWIERRERIRDHLLTVNLGLCFEMLHKTRVTNVDEDDLLSEGLRALFDAVEAFDPWRGFRFSTYACNAVFRGFLRLSKLQTRRSGLMTHGSEALMDTAWQSQTDGDLDERVYAARLQDVLAENGAELSSTERFVLDRRFPDDSNCKRETLDGIGRKIELSKERVRQIQLSALEKLHCALIANPVL